MLSHEHNGSLTIAERKRLLIAQGASYRTGINYSKAVVRGSLNVESIAKNALSRIAMGAVAAFKGGAALKGGNLRVLLPFALSMFSKLSKKPAMVKPIARGAVILGVVAAITRYVISRKKRRV
jgi:hypothetical protein